jgi:hypothetical protein
MKIALYVWNELAKLPRSIVDGFRNANPIDHIIIGAWAAFLFAWTCLR